MAQNYDMFDQLFMEDAYQSTAEYDMFDSLFKKEEEEDPFDSLFKPDFTPQTSPDVGMETGKTLKPLRSEQEYKQEELPEGKYGILGDIGSGIVAGLHDWAEMPYRVARSFDPPGGTDVVRDWATKQIEDIGLTEKVNPELIKPSKGTNESEFRKAVYGGFRAMGPSAVSGAVGMLLGGPAGAGKLTAALFGLTQYDKAIENSMKEGKSFGEALPYAIAEGGIEGGFEGLATWAGAKILGLDDSAIGPFKTTVKDMLKNSIAKYVGKTLTAAPVEVGTEMIQNAGQTIVRNLQGISDDSPLNSALDSIGPALVMTTLFGVSTSSMNAHQKKYIEKSLLDPTANAKDRVAASKMIEGELAKDDKEIAAQWNNLSGKYISEGLPIPIDIATKDFIANTPVDSIGKDVNAIREEIKAGKTEKPAQDMDPRAKKMLDMWAKSEDLGKPPEMPPIVPGSNKYLGMNFPDLRAAVDAGEDGAFEEFKRRWDDYNKKWPATKANLESRQELFGISGMAQFTPDITDNTDGSDGTGGTPIVPGSGGTVEDLEQGTPQAEWRPGIEVKQSPMDRFKVKTAGAEARFRRDREETVGPSPEAAPPTTIAVAEKPIEPVEKARDISKRATERGEMTLGKLNKEVSEFKGTGGIASENIKLGFRAAFRHKKTGEIFDAKDENGKITKVHLLDGIPDKYVTERDPKHGDILAVSGDIESGFIKDNKFYTRAEAVKAIEPVAQAEPVQEKGKEPETYDFSSTQVNLPEQESKGIKDFQSKIPKEELYIDPKGGYESGLEDQPHITVKYGLHTENAEDVKPLLAGQVPITAKMGKVSIFETDDNDVVKVDIDSPELHALNKKIADSLDVTDTYPTYNPHATIAYVKKGEGKKYVGDKSFEGKEIILNSLTFSGKDGKFTEIPLTGKADLAKPEAPVVGEKLPILKSTEEALAFGKTATPEQIETLNARREESLAKSKAFMDKGDFDNAMVHATAAQFDREAVEVAEKPVAVVEEEAKTINYKKIADELFSAALKKGWKEGGFDTPRVDQKTIDRIAQKHGTSRYDLLTDLSPYITVREMNVPGSSDKAYWLTRKEPVVKESLTTEKPVEPEVTKTKEGVKVDKTPEVIKVKEEITKPIKSYDEWLESEGIKKPQIPKTKFGKPVFSDSPGLVTRHKNKKKQFEDEAYPKYINYVKGQIKEGGEFDTYYQFENYVSLLEDTGTPFSEIEALLEDNRYTRNESGTWSRPWEETRFSKATTTTPKGMPVKMGNAIANKFKPIFKGIKDTQIVVLPSKANLGAETLEKLKIGPNELVKGLFAINPETGQRTIFLIMDAMDSQKDVISTLLEEVAHNGIKIVLDSNTLTNVYEEFKNDPKMLAILRAYKKIDVSTPEGKINAADEFIAKSIKMDLLPKSIWQKIVAAIRNLLRKNKIEVHYSIEEIKKLVINAVTSPAGQYRNATGVKGRPDDTAAAKAHTLRDLVKTKTFKMEGLSGFDIPTQRVVMRSMLMAIQNPKIRDAVISSVPVDVVDYLRSKKLTSKVFFHDVPMLKRQFSIDVNGNIPTGSDTASMVVSTTADVITKALSVPSTLSLSDRNSLSTGSTNPVNSTISRKTRLGTKDAIIPIDNFSTIDTLDFWHDITSNNIVLEEGGEGSTSLPSVRSTLPNNTKNVNAKNDQTSSIREMVAHHGTPHIWPSEPGFPNGRPRLDKIGTGEGGAAYGWGWYSAEEESLAKNYKDRLSESIYDDKNKVAEALFNAKLESSIFEDAVTAGKISTKYNKSDFIKAVVSGKLDYSDFSPATWTKADALLAENSSLYKLDIPDSEIPKLLDWDAPLSEQTEYVKKVLANDPVSQEVFDQYQKSYKSRSEGKYADPKYANGMTMGQFYSHLRDIATRKLNEKAGGDVFRPDDKTASEHLASIGIPGNVHGGVSKGATGLKYVIWDQSVLDKIALLERNQEPLKAMQGEAEADAWVRKSVATVDEVDFDYASPGMTKIKAYLEEKDMKAKWEKIATYLWNKDAAIERVQEGLSPQPETRDYALVTKLMGKKVADELFRFDRDRLKPLLADMAKSKVNIKDVQELLHADHAPERNLQMKRVNARRYFDDAVQFLAEKDAKPFKKRLVEIGEEFTLNQLLNNDSSINDKRDDTVILMDELSSVDTNAIKQELDDRQQALNDRTFTQEEMDKGTPERLQQRLNNAVKRLDSFISITKYWTDVKDRLSGMTNQESETIQGRHKNNKDINRIADTIRKINSDSLEILHDAKDISDDEYRAIRAPYNLHVPLMREDYPESKASSGAKGLARPLKLAYGSTRGVKDIFAHVIDRHQSAIERKHNLEAQKALYEMVKENPSDTWRIVKKLPKVPVYDNEGNLRMKSAPVTPKEYQTYVRVEGEKYLIEVNYDDESMIRFMDAVNREPVVLGPMAKTSRAIVQFLAKLNTSFSPEFMVTNFMRDLPTAMIHLESIGGAEGAQKAVLKNLKNAIKTIYQAERGKENLGPMGKWYSEFAKNGGKIGWMQSYDTVEKLAENLEKELAYAEGKYPNRAKLRKLGNWITSMNTAVENGVRLSAYKVMVENGMSPSKAARAASGLTIDFTQHGTVGPIINSFYMFANAGIQGNVRMISAVAKNKKVQKIAGGIVGFGAVANILGALIGGDDDDGEAYYDKLKKTNPELFERNMIFMIPGTKGRYFRIPMPYGYNTFFVLGNEIGGGLRSLFDKNNAHSAIEGMARVESALMGTLNPLASATLLQTVMPTIGDPIAQVFENKTWSGGPLMPEKKPFGLPKPDSERYFSTVNPVAKYIAQGMNWGTGGNKVKSGLIDVSPETIELVFETFTGSAGRLVKDALSLPMAAMSDDGLTMSKVPFVRKLVSAQSPYVDDSIYLTNSQEVGLLLEQYKVGDAEDKQTLRENPLIRMMTLHKSTYSQLLKLNKLRRQAEKDGRGESVKRIKDRMQDIKKKYNQRYNELMT